MLVPFPALFLLILLFSLYSIDTSVAEPEPKLNCLLEPEPTLRIAAPPAPATFFIYQEIKKFDRKKSWLHKKYYNFNLIWVQHASIHVKKYWYLSQKR
jgi:hypothetical protein